jgi:uncharacterized cupredoxin-like copper-binding protein
MRTIWTAAAGLMPLLLAACGAGAPTPSPAAATVNVTLQEWAVGTSATAARTGTITFAVTNQGPEDVHEFVVIKTDLSLIDLPTDTEGAVDEAADAMVVKGEIEDIAVGASEELTLTLEPGAYVLICNIYDAAEDEAHYQMGMRNSFTVTP